LPERQTHDYERHGTTTLFAALDVAAGKVIGHCQARHRHQEFIRFLEKVDTATDPGLPVHLILDNYGTHKHPEVKKWFTAHPRYPFTSHQPAPLGLTKWNAGSPRSHETNSPGNLSLSPRSGTNDSRIHSRQQQGPSTLPVGGERQHDHQEGAEV
jgi:hypothetical protein